ncbi:MAG: GIY-YIG nuclease family protein [Legionella sp.]|nr:GIY-YIG nuclease family protein [Legionella sp.]
MNPLRQKKILILDCQSTGIQAKTAHLLQIGWSLIDCLQDKEPIIESWILKLPQNEEIPKKIMHMQQLTPADILRSVEPQLVFNSLQQSLGTLDTNPMVVAHYAQFEQRFLKQLYGVFTGTEVLDFRLICTQKISKRLLPNLPSHTLKAFSGYLKIENGPRYDVKSHVAMTITIWQQLVSKLEAIGITCDASLTQWLNQKNKTPKPCQFEYNIERLIRLEFSTKPGVYKMLARDKTILYVGKATSLKSRVNSYFRGVKNRDRRILEMLAQVWHIETIECETPLEAALLESDEIKKYNPPYNILLKSKERTLCFFNHAYTQQTETKNDLFLNGPYKPTDCLLSLLSLLNALKSNISFHFFTQTIPQDMLHRAWDLFLYNNFLNESSLEFLDNRRLLAIGYRLLLAFEKKHGRGSFEKWWGKEKKDNPPDDLSEEQELAGKIARLFIRAAESMRKSRQIQHLYNSKLIIVATKKNLCIVNGDIINDRLAASSLKSPSQFTIQQYDRLSILLSAKNKNQVKFV